MSVTLQQLPTTRERLLDAARQIIETSGWSSVTMAKIASTVGVSRQTVHNELGTKHALAEALALRELDRFMDVVRATIADATNLVAGVRAACRGVLELGRESVLVRTIVGGVGDDQDVDFLTLLTTGSGEIVDAAGYVTKQAVVERFGDELPFTDAELDVTVELLVRLLLSHLTRPSKEPAEAADDVAWVIELALAGRSVTA